jgi:hypothetical protein
MGITPSMIAGAAGIGGALSGLFGGSSASSVPLPAQLPNVTQSANAAYSGIGNLSQYGTAANSTLGNAASTYQNLYNNPYATQAQTTAGTGSQMGMTGATNAYNAGGALTTAGLGLLPGAQAIMQQGFDPQQALYNQTLGQTTNAINANNVAAGLGSSPYGASVAGSGIGNFNVNWQNQQLGREATAASAASGLIGQAGTTAQLGTGMQVNAGNQYATAGAQPYLTAQGIGTNQNAATQAYLSNVSGAQGVSQQQIQDYLNYLQTAGGQNLSQSQLALAQQQQQFSQNQSYGQALGAGLYGLAGGSSGTGFGLNSLNTSAYANPGAGSVSNSEAAQAALATGSSYNPLTGAVG